MRLADLAGLRILGDRDGGVVDRPKSRTKLDQAMRSRPAVLPRPVGLLGLQHLAHRIADRDQLADDADVLFGQPSPLRPLRP
jgi:hypothetical protein